MVGVAPPTATYITPFTVSDQCAGGEITYEFYGYMPLWGCQAVDWV